MADINKVELTGTIFTDIKLDYVGQSGTAKAFFRLEMVQTNDKKQRVPITMWKDRAEEVANNFSKGDRVRIEGQYAVDSWKKDDAWQERHGVTAFKVTALEAGASRQQTTGDGFLPDEEVPF